MAPEIFAELLDTLFSLPPEKGKFVYFFGGGIGPIKIGYTKMPKQREKRLRYLNGADKRFLALCDGGRGREHAYHLKFEHLWIEGEWFERHPDILAEITRLQSTEAHHG